MSSTDIIYELKDNSYGIDNKIVYYRDSITIEILGSEFKILYHISVIDTLKKLDFDIDNVKIVYYSLKNTLEDQIDSTYDGDVIIFRDDKEYHISCWRELFNMVNNEKL